MVRERVERRRQIRGPPPAGDVATEDLLEHLVGGFGREHWQMDEGLDDVEALARRLSFVPATKKWGALRIAQERHIAAEEALLTAIEEAFGPCVSIQDAREAHARLKRLTEGVAQSLSQWDLPGFAKRFLDYRAELRRHWAHEAEVLAADLRLGLSVPQVRARVRDRLLRL